MKVRFLMVSLLVSLSGAAFAQATPKLDQREANQEKRIEQGAASGQLTPREERRLKAREARLNNAEARAKADGTVTGAERKHLNNMADADSKAIHHQKHDRQKDLDHDGKRDPKVVPAKP